MKNKINKTELERVASLAKLNMTRCEKETEENLAAVNNVIEKIIGGISKTRISSAAAPVFFEREQGIILRADIPKPSLPRKEVLANAGKNTDAGCISVPKMLERGEQP
jgi:aspartyl/glutamyl-tRNA(Asn/Gln) amidotransferase C subunit